jgi:glutaminyl-tRNA synthetase
LPNAGAPRAARIPAAEPDVSHPTSTDASAAADDLDAFARRDFVRAIVADDVRAGRYETIVTRFPPEPNGYLHIGHAKSLVLNFGIARETGGRCHLRFDDTNPETEDVKYVESIKDTVRWLGYEWGEHLYFAADYFDEMYAYAEWLIEQGRAYVDSSTEEEIREARGTVTEPGRPTRFRDRAPEESLDLFRRMKAGEFPDGAHVLRARIDLASKNMLLRDPILYRIRHAHHYRTGDRWCVYPLYDYAHPLEDAIEGITHSLCTLEFDNNRAVYDWTVEGWQDFVRSRGGTPARPHQYEFARGNLDYTVMSKRKLLELVNGGHVGGWDDPRLPTLAGLRRRGFTPESIRSFWERMGVTKVNMRAEIGALEHAVRDDLNHRAPRVLCVVRPLKLTITNYPEGQVEALDASYWPHDVPKTGSRSVPFSRELYIERDDFLEDPPKGYHRLAPGREVRLRYAYFVTCDEVVKDEAGEVVELRCSYDPATKGGNAPDGRSPKGTLHWVSAEHSLPCEVRLYDRLFSVPDPEAGEGDFKQHLNPESLVVAAGARVEPSVATDPAGSRYQFERLGYFVMDGVESRPDRLVFNRTVTLRDTWGKVREPEGRRPRGLSAQREEPEARSAGGKRRNEERGARSEGAAQPGTGAKVAGGNPRSAIRNPPSDRSPELESRRRRYEAELGLGAEEAELLTRDAAQADLFEDAVGAGASAKAAANWTVQELPRVAGGRAPDALGFGGRELGELAVLVENGTISTAAAREVLAEMADGGGPPAEIVERRGLRQISDEAALAPEVDAVLAELAAKAEEYRGGKTGLMGLFVGQVMRRTGGRANPELVRRLLEARLGG